MNTNSFESVLASSGLKDWRTAKISDLRLVVVDMDGTLLDVNGQIPADFWPLLNELRANNITFAVGSGRQYSKLQKFFSPDSKGIFFLCENGSLVAVDQKILKTHTLSLSDGRATVKKVRQLVAAGHDAGVVWCTPNGAYAERFDEPFEKGALSFYESLTIVDDLTQIAEPPLKLAVFDCYNQTPSCFGELTQFCFPNHVVKSGHGWLDVAGPTTNKGTALKELYQILGICADQCAAFGDYPNDSEMLNASGHAFAMANAHPEIFPISDYLAPPNSEEGVIQVVRKLLTD